MSFVEQILCSHISYWRLSSRLQPLRSHPYNLLHKIVHFPALVSRLLAPCFNACSLMFHVLHHFSQSLQSLVSRPTASHSFHWQRSSRLYFATAILSNSDSVLLWLKSDSEFPQSWDLSHCPSLTLYPFISFSGATASHFILSSKKFFSNVTSQICLVFSLLHSIFPIEACSLSSQAIQPLVLGPAASCCNVTFANVVFFPTFHTVWY